MSDRRKAAPDWARVNLRKCGCVYEAGCPTEVRKRGRRSRVVPIAEYRGLPWACPACSIEAARADERARVMAELAAAPRPDPWAESDHYPEG